MHRTETKITAHQNPLLHFNESDLSRSGYVIKRVASYSIISVDKAEEVKETVLYFFVNHQNKTHHVFKCRPPLGCQVPFHLAQALIHSFSPVQFP